MRIKFLITVFFIASFTVFSQKNTDVLFTINQSDYTVLDFKNVYEKNLNLINDENEKNVEEYLELFINYNLKLIEAYKLKLDTVKAYIREVDTYKNQLIAPYLQDTTFLSKLVKDAYYRTKYKVNVSHILVKIPRNAQPKDTLEAYNKIMKARNEVISGKPFNEVALKYSDDKSVKSNYGNLGYFTAFKMIYSFERMSYTTKVGDVSMPFRTRFGYHFVKVNDKQLSEGKVEVANILIADKTEKGKIKIDSIYNKLKNGEDFTQLVTKYSDDKNSIRFGGKLPKFGIGRMFKEFENQSFKLKNVGDFSKPFKSQFGWHIVKLINKYPVRSFKELEKELTNKVKATGGAKLSDLEVVRKLKANYKIKVNNNALKIFHSANIRAVKKDSLQDVLLTINEKQIKQHQFFNYIRNRRHKSILEFFEDFKNDEVLTYYKENLEKTEPEFAKTLKEYKEGLLVFDLMNKQVWKKSIKDTLGLQNYFKTFKNKYSFKELSKNKGKVMSDYQTFLENQLIATLRNKNRVIINRKTLKKLSKQYK